MGRLTLDVQEHALLVASDPAEGLAVEAAQVRQPHAADGQNRLAVAPPHLKASVLTLQQTHKTYSSDSDSERTRIVIAAWKEPGRRTFAGTWRTRLLPTGGGVPGWDWNLQPSCGGANR